ncbi:DUF1294 domain-containing protein [Clostridium algidicarnis]|uniref:DUF1294 domain-containing protein n=1 Tax=Clostridium algidicarnis TaxID=37659 RepID=UPI001C0B322C|nr:DUF1294 domain-containing protein [Clostridium algidicarnis]MBU3202906.1 DUF1294 domain-containing protein [Clostridium algidicarnis]MBU3211060.1 DUF1294 domain-containing protein [Clostridium algidicarnis]MBU3222432.1 DUF1294 domain-containing protein [Clostridium algidicarnis]
MGLIIIYKLILFYFIILNILGLLSMYIDKSKSKRSQWRIRENTLIIIAILGGSIGSYLGMKKFRHKTKHSKFKYGIPFIIFIQIIIIFLIFNKDGLSLLT